MRLREWMLDPDRAPAWVPLLVLAPVAVVAVVFVGMVGAPWWTAPIPLGAAAALWQFVAERLRARQGRPAD
jgi:hypothetical protein